ncbi:MAG: hypothetical protein WBK51_14645 [Polaromonas sp.]
MSQVVLNALVAHFIDMDRKNELYSVEAKVKKGRPLKERALIMIAFAKARVAHPSFGKRFGLK